MTRADTATDGFVAEGRKHDCLFKQFVAAIEHNDHDEAERLSIELSRCHWRMRLWLRRME